jgi:hypothetical protein
MGGVNRREPAADRENDIRKAKHAYLSGEVASIGAAASTYSIPFGTLRDRFRGAQPRSIIHDNKQLLTPEDEKSIIRFCEPLDDLGHPLQGKMVKDFALSLLPPQRRRQLGKHWITRFLNRHPGITSKCSQRLVCQRANANDPVILRDFFRKVS